MGRNLTPADLIAELTRRGVRLEARRDRLRFSPPSAVTPDLLELLKMHKAVILAYLAGECCSLSPVTRPTIGGPKLFCPVCCRRVGGDQPYPWSARP